MNQQPLGEQSDTSIKLEDSTTIGPFPYDIYYYLAHCYLGSRNTLSLAQTCRALFFNNNNNGLLALAKKKKRQEMVFYFATGSRSLHNFWLYNGKLYTWGDNFAGQLGLGDLESRSGPNVFNILNLQLALNDSIKVIQCGSDHTIVISRHGRCYIWGSYNKFDNNKLPKLVVISRNTCIPIELNLSDLHLDTMDCIKRIKYINGIFHILTEQGRCFAKTPNMIIEFELNLQQFTPKDRIIDIEFGVGSLYMLTEQGRCFAVGCDHYGKAELQEHARTNKPINLGLLLLDLTTQEYIKQIKCSQGHALLLTSQNRCFAWGSNEFGQLGLGDDDDYKESPIALDLSCLKLTPDDWIIHIDCGMSHTVILTKQGRIFACGGNENGQLGLGDNEDRNIPTELNLYSLNIKAGDHIIDIHCGCKNTIIFTEHGRCFACGYNEEGQLGLGNTEDKNILVEVFLPHLINYQRMLSLIRNDSHKTLERMQNNTNNSVQRISSYSDSENRCIVM